MKRQNNVMTLAPYLGGKGRLVPQLTELIDKAQDVSVYGELFGGMGAVLLNKAPHPHEMYNDLDPSNYCIFKCLSTPEYADKFIKAIFETDYNEENFQKYRDIYDSKYAHRIQEFERSEATVPEQEAFDTFIADNLFELGVTSLVLIKMSYAGLIRRKSFLGYKDGAEGQRYDDWKFKLDDIAERLNGVEVLNRDALDIIKAHADDPHAIFLCDPPYYGNQRSGGKNGDTENEDYNEDWPKEKHEEFLSLVKSVKCKIIICNYQSDDKLYDEALCACGFHSFCIGVLAKNAKNNGKGESRDRVEEWVWVNYPV